VWDRPPKAISGDGLFVHVENGDVFLDASGGGPVVSCLGHGSKRIAEAIGRQAAAVAYLHTWSFTSEPAEALAQILVGEEPGGLTHAFFVSSGSEAMESAIKLARQYFLERGEPERSHFIARRQSYHGNTLGALSLGCHVARRQPYGPMLAPWVSHVSPCFPYREQRDHEDDKDYVARLAGELEDEFQRVGPSRIAAFCAETVIGATAGCVTALPGYFEAMRKVCDRHGALLILDEVQCGVGRTGSIHAWEQEGVSPDIQAIAKGLGGGYQPIGGILISGRVVEALAGGSGAFVHGHTYQAHPVACAGALEVQRIIREENLLNNVRAMGEVLRANLDRAFADHPNVGDIRGRGLFLALEFVADRRTRRAFDPSCALADKVRRFAMEEKLVVYPSAGTIDGRLGDHVIVAPAYNVTADRIDEIVKRLGRAIDKAVRAAGAR
jgi:adenosylmethionine-8-amino-7-oxononanoate aminotransferase